MDIHNREELGVWAHTIWLTVMKQQRKAGLPANKRDLTLWDELDGPGKEVFRKSGETLLATKKAKEDYDEMMWAEVARQRKIMGERAFRAKVFEISVAEVIDRIAHQMTDAEKYQATSVIVKLAGMLETPPAAVAAFPRQS